MPLNTTYGAIGTQYNASTGYDGILLINAYTELETVKARLQLTGTTDQDIRLSSVITAVSRWVDSECNRYFFVNAAQTRYYTPTNGYVLNIDDFTSLTSVLTDIDGDGTFETTWTATDYTVAPYNARSESPAQPYTQIQRRIYGAYVFPTPIQRSVAVTADFGYDSLVPLVIQEATIIQVCRIWRRSDAPFGITGSADMGQAMVLPKMDPDVRMMLAPYKKWTVV